MTPGRVLQDRQGYRLDFWPHHRANPHIYEAFNRIAHALIRRGWKRGSAYLVFERIRWESAVRTRNEDTYKLNNNFRPDYARLWLARNPEFPTWLEVRNRLLPVATPDDEIDMLLS